MEPLAADTSSIFLTGRYVRPRVEDPAGHSGLPSDACFAQDLLADLAGKDRLPVSYCRLRPIDGDPSSLVEDKPFSAHVLGPEGHVLAVLSLSNAAYPGLVARQVEGAAVARLLLGPLLGERILKPLAAGFVAGRGFAIWPLRCPLSTNLLRKAVEKRRLAEPVFDWLRAVARQTLIDPGPAGVAGQFAEPLFRMAEDIDLDASLRKVAREGIAALDSGEWTPKAVLSHNDLWMGNVLMEDSPFGGVLDPRSFTVIDWAGSARMGYPFIDTLTWGESIGRDASALRRDLLASCDELTISPRHVAGHLCAALGATALKADCFPRSRFIGLCNSIQRSLQKTGFLDSGR